MSSNHTVLISGTDFSSLYNAFCLEVAITVTSFDLACRMKKVKRRHLDAKGKFTRELIEHLGMKPEYYKYWLAFSHYRLAREIPEVLRTADNAFVDDLNFYLGLIKDDEIEVDLEEALEVRLELEDESIFPSAEEVDLDHCNTLRTTVDVLVHIPTGMMAEGDSSSLELDGELWHVGVWLYNDGESRCLVPHTYLETVNVVMEGAI